MWYCVYCSVCVSNMSSGYRQWSLQPVGHVARVVNRSGNAFW